jgi:ubiquinol-cytochrome c reductase cytochrome c1 subunit
MKRLLLMFSLLLPIAAFASSGLDLQAANNNLHDKKSLQRGAKLFVNYCMGCHSLQYMRYQRMGEDIGIPKEVLEKNFMFNTDKVGELMTISMKKADAEKWFGVAPPDLSVIARARGVDWLYTYLLSFYLDNKRPVGINNLVFKDVGMPHVLWELQGWQTMAHEEPAAEGHESAEGHGDQGPSLTLENKAQLTAEKHHEKVNGYRRDVRDLVNFLAYVGEPMQLERRAVGKWVIFFLIVFLIVAYALKKEYWRDIH